MGSEEISYEDLLDDEPAAETTRPASYRELLHNGLAMNGGIKELAAMTAIEDSDPRAAALRAAYRQLLASQLRAAGR